MATSDYVVVILGLQARHAVEIRLAKVLHRAGGRTLIEHVGARVPTAEGA